MVEIPVFQHNAVHTVLTATANRLNHEVPRQPRLDVYYTNLEHRVSQFIPHGVRRLMRARAEEITNA